MNKSKVHPFYLRKSRRAANRVHVELMSEVPYDETLLNDTKLRFDTFGNQIIKTKNKR